jgi:hypothetical protein
MTFGREEVMKCYQSRDNIFLQGSFEDYIQLNACMHMRQSDDTQSELNIVHTHPNARESSRASASECYTVEGDQR